MPLNASGAETKVHCFIVDYIRVSAINMLLFPFGFWSGGFWHLEYYWVLSESHSNQHFHNFRTFRVYSFSLVSKFMHAFVQHKSPLLVSYIWVVLIFVLDRSCLCSLLIFCLLLIKKLHQSVSSLVKIANPNLFRNAGITPSCYLLWYLKYFNSNKWCLQHYIISKKIALFICYIQYIIKKTMFLLVSFI